MKHRVPPGESITGTGARAMACAPRLVSGGGSESNSRRNLGLLTHRSRGGDLLLSLSAGGWHTGSITRGTLAIAYL
jgi:hypothetical protein